MSSRPEAASRRTFIKRRAGAPEGFFAVEAAGLTWLADAGGVAAPRPVEVAPEHIALPSVPTVAPTVAAAEDFGRALARTHLAGAAHHGCPPVGWTGDGFIGPAPLPHAVEPTDGWGPFFAGLRIRPFLSGVEAGARVTFERLCDLLTEQDERLTGPPEPPARLHGDLWSGNVLWSPDGVVLVDPAAHGGHRESDLAMLALFGLPHLERVLAAYDEVHPLAEGWRDRVALHQVFPLLVHSVLFGGRYSPQAVAAASRYV